MVISPMRDARLAPSVAKRDVPTRRIGWGRRLARVWNALGHGHISIMAAGTAYYVMLAIFPGLSALVLTYGLIADPATIERHVDALSGLLPAEALTLLSDRLHALVTAAPEKIGLGLVVSVLVALWSATSGTVALMQALTVAYEGEEDRGVFRFYGLAVALTIGLVLFGFASLVLIAGVPAVITRLPLPELWQEILSLVRWPILALLAVLGLGLLYRVAPSRPSLGWDFFRAGTIAASLLWLGGSAAFSFYAAHSGSYDRTYGSLGAVAIMLVWLYVTTYTILAGAELNGEIERAHHDGCHECQFLSIGGPGQRP
jgi:membrane protein